MAKKNLKTILEENGLKFSHFAKELGMSEQNFRYHLDPEKEETNEEFASNLRAAITKHIAKLQKELKIDSK